MIERSALRIALGTQAVSIWSPEIFGDVESSRLRVFFARAFAVQEVEHVEVHRAASFGRVHCRANDDPAQIWRKLSRALRLESPSRWGGATAELASTRPSTVDAGSLYLGPSGTAPVHVTRIGDALSTWRVRRQSSDELRLAHPALRNSREVVFRLEEVLASFVGVKSFRASAVTATVLMKLDVGQTTAERVAVALEKAWPRLLEGLEGPPSQKRLVASVGLAGLAYAGQYLVPALRPIAVAGITVYSAPNGEERSAWPRSTPPVSRSCCSAASRSRPASWRR
jgi:hypothetical protein